VNAKQYDVLCDEGEAYGQKLIQAGIEVTAARVTRGAQR
jgi:acetyl esterase/lipase